MMAERKRKVKWSLNPRGKDWSQNSNKFGQKILEKMGWSEGKGLGANEDGMTSHIRVAYKNDTQGMGFKDTDDQWVEHQTNFTKLLNTLVDTKEGVNGENGPTVKLESLEKKSQSSKARVHYKKFTRGKDLTRYSEKDLANIFGKKSLDELSNTTKEQEEKTDEKENQEGKSFGVVTHNGGNMLDYFKKKLPNFKNKISNSAPQQKNGDSESDIDRPSFGLGFGNNGTNNESNHYQQKNNMKNTKTNGSSEPTDNFRKTCFGLGYDRYNKDDSKPKSKFTPFVKASTPEKPKQTLEYGISFINKKNVDTNCSGVDDNNSRITKIQSSFMSFVKGSDNVGAQIAEKGDKNKKRKRKHDEDFCNEDKSKKKKKYEESDITDEKNVTDKNGLGTDINGIEVDECMVQKKNKKKNKKKQNGECVNDSQEIKNIDGNDSTSSQKNGQSKSSLMSFIKDTLSIENAREEKKKKKKDKHAKQEDNSVAENGNEEDHENSIIKKKKKKGDKSDNSVSDEATPFQKAKKRKSDSELDVAFTPMKKKFKNFEDLHILQDEEKIVATPEKTKKNKKSKKEKDCGESEGLSNPAFDPLYTQVNHVKHQLDAIVEEPENVSGSPVDVREDEKAEVTTKRKSKKNKGDEGADTKNVENSDKKDKKKKSKHLDDVDNLCAEEISEDNKAEKTKKKKKKCRSVEGLDNPCLEDTITDQASQSIGDSEISETKEKKKKSKKIKNNTIGIENSAFDDTVIDTTQNGENKYEIKEKKKKKKEVQPDTSVEKKKKKNKISETAQEVENPCFTLDDSIEVPRVTPNKYEVKRSKSKENLGIVNPALDLTTPPQTNGEKNGSVIEDMPVVDENSLMLNVVCTPIIKKENKKLQRRKSVRFSETNQSIFINHLDSPADLKKNGGGVDNAAYDQFGNQIEENIDTLSKQLDDYQAEVENDLNEAKMQITVGETADPNGENEILPNGEAKLRLKYAKFGRLPPWLKKDINSPKSSYRHLIKGDIVLGFKNTNIHLIQGYNENVKSCST